jgi:ribosomal protein S18 acetylase RimI-like enzyme
MIRAARPADKQSILDLMVAAGLFVREALPPIEAIFDESFSEGVRAERRWIVCEHDGQLAGAAYYAHETVSDRVWNLFMIAVLPDTQGRGIGQEIVRHVEVELTSQGERILIVETSSLEDFARTRKFYIELGFVEEARIRRYYGDGNDKIVFYKALSVVPLDAHKS